MARGSIEINLSTAPISTQGLTRLDRPALTLAYSTQHHRRRAKLNPGSVQATQCNVRCLHAIPAPATTDKIERFICTKDHATYQTNSHLWRARGTKTMYYIEETVRVLKEAERSMDRFEAERRPYTGVYTHHYCWRRSLNCVPRPFASSHHRLYIPVAQEHCASPRGRAYTRERFFSTLRSGCSVKRGHQTDAVSSPTLAALRRLQCLPTMGARQGPVIRSRSFGSSVLCVPGDVV